MEPKQSTSTVHVYVDDLFRIDVFIWRLIKSQGRR